MGANHYNNLISLSSERRFRTAIPRYSQGIVFLNQVFFSMLSCLTQLPYSLSCDTQGTNKGADTPHSLKSVHFLITNNNSHLIPFISHLNTHITSIIFRYATLAPLSLSCQTKNDAGKITSSVNIVIRQRHSPARPTQSIFSLFCIEIFIYYTLF